jgi:hypothetical protein
MSYHLRRQLAVAFAALACAALEVRAQAADQVAVFTCQQAAVALIRVPIAESDSARFAPNWRVSRPGGGKLVVEGNGTFQHRAGTGWHRFSYVCTYFPEQSSEPNVAVKFQPQNRDRDRDDSYPVRGQQRGQP